MPSARLRTQPAPSIAPFIVVGGIGLAVYAGMRGYPPVVAVWAALLVAAWTEQPAVFTGRKDSYGYPTAATDAERSRMTTWEMWRDLRVKLVLPNGDWLPSWPVLGSFVAALLAAVAAQSIPVTAHGTFTVPDGRLVDALAAFVVVAQVSAARRKVAADDCPGTRFDALASCFSGTSIFATTVALVSGAALGAVAGAVAVSEAQRYRVAVFEPTELTIALAILGAGLVVSPAWRRAALDEWRVLSGERLQWAPRWLALKYDPAPRLVGRDEVGPATVLTFDAPPHLGSVEFLAGAKKLLPTLGAGMQIAVLPVPNVGPMGPMPGTKHPTSFQVVLWDATQLPSMSDPSVSDDAAGLFASCAMAWALEPLGYGRPVLLSVEKLTDPSSSVAAWESHWAWPDGPSLTEIRPLTSDIAAQFGVDVLIDHREDVVYFGALTGGVLAGSSDEAELASGPGDEPTFPASGQDWPAVFANLATEERWLTVWESVLKSGANPPTIQHATYTELGCRTTSGEFTIFRQAFTTRLGVDPAEFRGLEPKLATALESAPFVTVTGWAVRGDRPGERHPQAFAVCWSMSQLPNIERIAPSPGAKLALAGLMNGAFDALRLARPEVATAEALTAQRSTAHLWSVSLRLYGGVTSADVRSRSERLRQTLGVTWLRVSDADDGCVVYLGADPGSVDFDDPDTGSALVASLDWAQAWMDASVSNADGELPELVSVGSIAKNPNVRIFEFTIPPGVDKGRIRRALPALRSATNNEFVEARDVEGSAAKIRILCSRTNPLPELVPFDFDAVNPDSDEIPFATGVDGETVSFDPGDSPHALLAGTTGSGKAQPLDTVIPVPVSPKFPLGRTTIGRLGLGDEVFAPDGSTASVIGLSEVSSEPVFRIEFDDGQVVRCSGRHLWVVVEQACRPRRGADIDGPLPDPEQVKAIADDAVGNEYASVETVAGMLGVDRQALDSMGASLLTVPVCDRGEEVDLLPIAEVASTLADVLLGRRTKLVVTAEHLEAMVGRRSWRRPRWSVLLPRAVEGHEVPSSTKPFDIGLALAAMEESGRPDVHIPRCALSLLRSPIEQRREALRGWASRSPSLRWRGRSYVADFGSSGLAGVLAELVRSLGVKASVSRSRRGLARVRFWPGAELLGVDCPRVAARILGAAVRPGARHAVLRIRSVTQTGDAVPMRCIVVDHPRHQYLTDGFVPTHNSVMARAFLYGAAIKRHDVYIVDPVKAGADFEFARPYAKAVATNVLDAAALMSAVRKEVDRRKALNAAKGVASGDELPPDERYPRITLLIDEFTSLVGKEPVGDKSDDPAAELERERTMMENQARAMVGSLAGRIAREARSARVTLLLGTQKLAHKTLDQVPGGNDLKDLTLDTRLPVPCSEKFPTGWARNGDLEIGDLLYTPAGHTAPVIGFSEVFTDNDAYAVTFDDGQVVKAGAGHLWLASDHRSRRRWLRFPASAHNAGYAGTDNHRLDVADLASAIAKSTPIGTYAGADEIANLLGLTKATVIEIGNSLGIQRVLLDPSGHVHPYDHRVTPWLASETALGRPVTRGEVAMVGRRLDAMSSVKKTFERHEIAFDLAGFLCSFSRERRASLGRDPADGALPPLERLVTTEEMASALVASDGTWNWAIGVSAPIQGEDRDLPVDPYVLGVWLGDKCTGGGIVVSTASAACTGDDGVTDQDHTLRQLTVPGYEPHVLQRDKDLIGTYGFKSRLREIGVFDHKHIPSAYLRASFAQRLALLQGIMDTDGTLMASGRCSIGQTSREMADGIVELLRSLGVKARRSQWPARYADPATGRIKVTGIVYHTSFRTDLPAFRLRRKVSRQALPVRRGQTAWRRIVAIEPIGKVPTRCIAVDDPEHLFLVEGFIPTHNTNLARSLLGKATSGERMSALRSPDAAPALDGEVPKGRGIWEPLTTTGAVVQCWFADQGELREQLRQRRPPLAEADILDLQPFRPHGYDRLFPDDQGQPSPQGQEVIEVDRISLDLSDLLSGDSDPARDTATNTGDDVAEHNAGADDEAGDVDGDDPWGGGEWDRVEPAPLSREAAPAGPVEDDDPFSWDRFRATAPVDDDPFD